MQAPSFQSVANEALFQDAPSGHASKVVSLMLPRALCPTISFPFCFFTWADAISYPPGTLVANASLCRDYLQSEMDESFLAPSCTPERHLEETSGQAYMRCTSTLEFA